MGSWTITVHGHGIHDNDKEGDVDKLLEQFLLDLKAKGGHVIEAATLTVGGGRKYYATDEYSPDFSEPPKVHVTKDYF